MHKRKQIEHTFTWITIITPIMPWEEQIPIVYKVIKRSQKKGSEDINNEES